LYLSGVVVYLTALISMKNDRKTCLSAALYGLESHCITVLSVLRNVVIFYIWGADSSPLFHRLIHRLQYPKISTCLTSHGNTFDHHAFIHSLSSLTFRPSRVIYYWLGIFPKASRLDLLLVLPFEGLSVFSCSFSHWEGNYAGTARPVINVVLETSVVNIRSTWFGSMGPLPIKFYLSARGYLYLSSTWPSCYNVGL